MKSYDEIVGKLITSAMDMERFVVEQGEPLYVREKMLYIYYVINKRYKI